MSTATIDYDALAQQHGGTGAGIDYDALAAQHGGSPAQVAASQATDTRNAVQRYVDNLTTVTPEQEAGHGAFDNRMQEFGAGAIQGVTAPFVHPMETLEGIGNTIVHPAKTAAAMAQGAMANPAQTAGNVVGSALLGEAAAPAAEVAGKVAGVPISRALLLGKTPAEAYESALKPSTTLNEAQRANIVQTGLQQGIPVSKSGLETLSDRVDQLNQAIKDQIAADPNRPISTVPAMRNLDAVRAKFGSQVTPQPDLAEIQSVQENFQNNPKVAPVGAGPSPGSMPAVDAQAMKQGTYQALGSKSYGEVKGASIEAQKALARGLKDEIASQFPEINDLNASESKLLDLQPVLERAVNRISNHQLVGIGTPIVAGTAKAVTGSAGAGVVAGVIKSVLDNPMVKSRLAISLSRGAKIPYAQAVARIGAYSSALQASTVSAQASLVDQTGNIIR